MRYFHIIAALSLMGALALSLSACTPAAPDASQSGNHPPLCHTKDAPFAYSYCHIDTSMPDRLNLFWQNDEGEPLLTFDHLIQRLPDDPPLFAMNAGMYNEDFAPIGYTVIEGFEVKSLNVNEGGGNFHLLPNGVFWQDTSGTLHITESLEMQDKIQSGITPNFATQSGPMLVIDNQIHPKFNKNSASKKIRNGVGVCTDGAYFVISDTPVTFYEFAMLFKENLGCPNALFLDGGIASALHAPDIERSDGQQMGVMIGMI